MIKLIVATDSNHSSYSFTKKVITIGRGSSPEVDISLAEPRIQAIHLKITEEDGFFLLINCANDPFTSLNGIPFGKKILAAGDAIRIGRTLISIEDISAPEPALPDLNKSLDSLISAKNEAPIPFDVEKELSSLEQQVDEATLGEALDIESLMEEVKQFEEPEEVEEAPPKVEPPPPEPKKTVKAETHAPREDEEIKKVPERKISHFPHHAGKSSNWRLLLAVLFSCLTLVLVCGAIVYVNVSDKTENEEMIAAKGISDVAMALTYAQVNHINPQMQNWSDPKFLKTNFAAIMPPDSPFLANIDSHGHFNDCPYILRIYTNKDFSRFLVIALPAPSVLQWLIPKNAVIVDSQAMELRKIQDLRALNRLLVHPNTLEGQNGMEISALVKQGNLLPLRLLATKTGNLDFSPPKTLASLRPGAENYIYNAPRYHQFGETYAHRALNLTKASERGSHELMRLQEEMLEVAKLPHLVIYSSLGMEASAQAKKAIQTFIPQAKFLNAYIIYNKQGEIVSSNVLLEDNTLSNEEEIAQVKPHFLHPELKEDLNSKQMDDNHPLKFQLSALSNRRKQALEPLANEMTAQLRKHTAEYDEHFSTKFSALLKEYEAIDEKEREAIADELHTLYDNYAAMPLSKMLPYTKAAGLGQIARTSLRTPDHFNEEQFEKLLAAIRQAKNFAGLEEATAAASEFVRIKNIPQTETLITYQNKVRAEVTKKLDEFLLSPNVQLSNSDLVPTQRKLLIKILEQSWISDREEQRFYLHEFDILATDQPQER